MSIQHFPGAVGLTHLEVYESAAPDGQHGGSPHMHLACAELYMVQSGHGAVELLSIADGFQRIELHPGSVLHFTPGVIHRLINTDGKLTLFIIMQNSGLPERGDAVFSFPMAYLADNERYAEAATARDRAAAERRRDLAVEGFCTLAEVYATNPDHGKHLLREFHTHALRVSQAKAQRWPAVVEAGPGAAVRDTMQQLEAIATGDPAYLAAGTTAELPPIDRSVLRPGMCGMLWPYLPEGLAHH